MNPVVYQLTDTWRLAGALIAAAAAISIAFGICRAGNFIGEVLHEQDREPFNRAMNWIDGVWRALGLSLFYAPSLLFAFRGRRFLGARYYCELQILLPRVRSPHKSDYTAIEYERRLAAWRDSETGRRTTMRRLLKDRLSDTPGPVFAFAHWLLSLLRLIKPDHQPLQPVRIESFPELDDSRPRIKRYFEALERRKFVPANEAAHFLTEVRFDIGYVAPMFLITGLVNRFADEDGWSLVLDNYRKLIEHDDAYSEELRELRSFLFNCWLLWGPSIPPCSCSQWKSPGSIETGNRANDDLMIQYGYGDENNSIDLLVRGGLGEDFGGKLSARLNRHAGDYNGRPFAISAAPFIAAGRFRWGPSLAQNEICPAQKLVAGGANPETRQPINGRIVLECAHNQVEVAPVTESSRYYSAYLWLMFVIHDDQGNCFHEQPWKNLLAFFEHGNIADASTFQTLKEQLVVKTCVSLTKVLSETIVARPSWREPQRELRISYACAFDDSNCGAGHGALFSADKLGGKDRFGKVEFEDVSIPGILRRYLATLPQDHVLRSGRLIMPSDAAQPGPGNPFSSCHLPEFVEQFYAELLPQAVPLVKPPSSLDAESDPVFTLSSVIDQATAASSAGTANGSICIVVRVTVTRV